MNDKKYKFKFSVIIPIYNVEKYLEETILSIIKQTIGFKESIQMILVNDGSPDNSEKICLKYKEKYPQNIEYIYQDNKGVSSARNAGIEFIKGKYVNFFDADDIWNTDVFEKVYKFFEQNEKEIDVVACRQKFFEAQEGFHKLDYKFTREHIVDINKDYEEIQLSMSSAFIKSDILKLYRYDVRLQYSEDATLIGQIIMQKSKYGILSDAIYNYRKRNDNNSALQVREENKSWYFNTIEYGYKLLINKSIDIYGKVIPYIQYHIMYDFQWRLNKNVSMFLTQEEQDIYIKSIIEILQNIEDKIIFTQKYLKKEYKILALCLKYKRDIRKEFYFEDSKIRFKDLNIYKIKNKSFLKIDSIKINKFNTNLNIKGKITCLLPEEDYKIFIKQGNGKKNYIEKYKDLFDIDSIVGKLNNSKGFDIDIPLNKKNIDLRFVIDYKTNKKSLNINFTQLAKLSEENNKIFIIDKKHNISFDNNQIFVRKLNNKNIKILNNKYKQFLSEIGKNEIIELRECASKTNRFLNIYIKFINNNMYVIKTIRKWNNDMIDSNKWHKIENIYEKKLYILKSKIIIGKEKDVKNIFNEDEKYIKDLYNFNYVIKQ